MDRLRQHVEHIESLANLMDSRFRLPGTDIRLGLDTLIGFVPGIGDTVGLGISSYIVAHAHKAGVGKPTLLRMIWNVFIDWLIGLIPLIGDLFDWGWKANNRNAALLRAHYERELARRGPPEDTLVEVGSGSTLPDQSRA